MWFQWWNRRGWVYWSRYVQFHGALQKSKTGHNSLGNIWPTVKYKEIAHNHHQTRQKIKCFSRSRIRDDSLLEIENGEYDSADIKAEHITAMNGEKGTIGYLRCLSRFSEEFVALHGPLSCHSPTLPTPEPMECRATLYPPCNPKIPLRSV